MGLKDFFETSNAVEFGIMKATGRQAADKQLSDLSEAKAATEKALKHSEDVLREIEESKRRKTNALKQAGILLPSEESSDTCKIRLSIELDNMLGRVDSLMERRSEGSPDWDSEAALTFIELSEILSRVRFYNNITESYDAIVVR